MKLKKLNQKIDSGPKGLNKLGIDFAFKNAVKPTVFGGGGGALPAGLALPWMPMIGVLECTFSSSKYKINVHGQGKREGTENYFAFVVPKIHSPL